MRVVVITADRAAADALIRAATARGHEVVVKAAGDPFPDGGGDAVTFVVSASMSETEAADAIAVAERANAGAVRERRHMESQLQLSDRMAAVGTLAGGVAHEINNPLTSAIGNLG